MLSRRELIGKAAVGAAGALAVSAAGVASARALHAAADDVADGGDRRTAVPPPGDADAPAAPPPWDLLNPLVAGSVVATGWRLVDLSPVLVGSVAVTRENESGRSQRFTLHCQLAYPICRRYMHW